MSRSRSARIRSWEEATASADLVVVGPSPPLRGGIAAHTARLVEQVGLRGGRATAASYRRLYPSLFFPGRFQRSREVRPVWCEEVLDVMAPVTWTRLGGMLSSSTATVLLQWWHPVVAPALRVAIAAVPRRRLVGLCHNVMPHEAFPASAAAARWVLGRCGTVVCHSRAQAEALARVLGPARVRIEHVPLPSLLRPDPPAVHADAPGPEPPALRQLRRALPDGARVLVAAGHMRAYKGLDLLVEAWKLARRPAEARLVLVGECYLRGSSRRRLQAMVESDSSIVFLDQYLDDSEFVGFLGLSEALVAAHLRASQSGVLSLARAMGLPCILSDAGGLGEQMNPAADRLVRAGDGQDLAAAIEEHFSRPVRRDGKGPAPRRVCAETFDDEWQRVVEAIGVFGRR